MEGDCVLCKDKEGVKLCLVKLKGLFRDYEDVKNEMMDYGIVESGYGGRLSQFVKNDTVQNVLLVRPHILFMC